MQRVRDIVVVGGGISGLATALTLRISSRMQGRSGSSVLLIDSGRLGETSATIYNGGTIHTGASYALGRSNENRLEAEWCRRTAATVMSALPQQCVIDRKSWYLVGHANIDRYRRRLDDLELQHERCSRHELSRILQRDVATSVGGVVIDELQIDMLETMLRFTQACLDEGVEIVVDEPVSAIVDNTHSGFSEVRLSGSHPLMARRVVICAGGDTTHLLQTLSRPPESVLRQLHKHPALHIAISQGDLTHSVRGVEAGFPVVTQLRGRQSISLYGVPRSGPTHEIVRETLRTFRKWFLPGSLKLDDVVTVARVNKVEFHDRRLARCTLPRLLNGPELGSEGVLCVIPGKVSHAISLALMIPRLVGINEVPAELVLDRLDCTVAIGTRSLVHHPSTAGGYVAGRLG